MKIYLIALLITLTITFFSGIVAIPFLRKIKAGQTVLKYVETHKEKNGTPTMGGLFFILPAILVFYVFGGEKGKMAMISVSIGFAFLLVGAIDDYLKIKRKQNEGLKSYQKILFQSGVALLSGIFAYRNGITTFYIPFFNNTVELGYWTIPLCFFIFLAITNSVNLTDGIDGLASSVSAVYLFFISIIILCQITFFDFLYLKIEEYQNLILLSFSLIGGLLGFLIFNTNKAKVFMGDTGSLAIGGFIGAISVFSSNIFYSPLLGITFVMSALSVIIQVYVYKRKGKRVFLMSPYHHHLQLKGYSESQISFYYSLITSIVGVLTIIFYF